MRSLSLVSSAQARPFIAQWTRLASTECSATAQYPVLSILGLVPVSQSFCKGKMLYQESVLIFRSYSGMRRFFNFFYRKNLQQQNDETATVANESVVELKKRYFTDSPINNPEKDRFKRWSFAERVAQTIASRSDPSSIVIGIYGPWGDGKTTVLNFIEQGLKESPNIICVKFNPWRFTDEVNLIKGFFKALAEAIGKSITSPSEKVGELLDKYSSGLTGFNLTFFGSLRFTPGQGIQSLGKTLSSVELEILKKRLESLLKNAGKRVVVLIDDIDRIDKNEIQAVFKLVKLSADFDNTAYILAFDEEMVATALSEKYGLGDIKAGRNFLEKIIQVPLNLPKADRVALLEYCMEGIEDILSDTGIQFSEEEFRYYFFKNFVDGLEIGLKTPRMAKRYINALAFSLPILKGEVNLLDLMLVEGMRVFYPALYDVVRNKPEIFSSSSFSYFSPKEFPQHSLEVINRGIQGLTVDEAEAAKNLLKTLFPRLNQTGILGNIDYVYNWTKESDIEQRVSSAHYFNRFFSYSISNNDISDQELTSFLAQLENSSIEDTVLNIRRLIGEQQTSIFVLKVQSRIKNLSSLASKNLALAISLAGDVFPENRTFIANAFSGAGILISQLVNNIESDDIKMNIARQIVLQTSPISFAFECFKWLIPREEGERIERPLSSDQGRVIGEAFAQRIKQLSQASPLYLQFPEDAHRLIYVWSCWSYEDEVNQHLVETLSGNSQNAVEFLKCYLPTQLSSAHYGTRKGNFERTQYDDLARLVDPNLIYELIRNIYGSALDNPQYDSDNPKRSLEQKVVNQFALIHQIVTKDTGNGENQQNL
ncbi:MULTISPECIES: KAP family P-loop NTPase fold protein [Cyanophyceae]|uniref:KAP family P-loop NTPase fold protein n=1 Tax=Cyanophyceae TaxID=3028117 RepID=UPI00168404EF|nr:KAP family NTPase [Trichocoleus sp. FACHB-40]MBD2005222.1 KAP family NTPase [Trichocoleus sp. FACHB-40]